MNIGGSPIWEMCNSTAQIITQKLRWCPGNDKEIKIWTNHYASVTPGVLAQAVPELRHKLDDMRIKLLHDLSVCSSSGRWIGWHELEIGHLNADYLALITVLPTPVHHALKDKRGWGKAECYTMKARYKAIDEVYSKNNNDGKWKKIWSKNGLPKIKFFFWILGHGKTLTIDNLRKRGLEGPLRCILCKECEESLQHLFLECKFSREVWHQAYKELQFELTLPTIWDDIFCKMEGLLSRLTSQQTRFRKGL